MLKELYFLNSRELSKKLHREEISDELAFNHLLVYSMLFASYIAIPIVVTCTAGGVGFGWWYQLLYFLASAGVQYWGMTMLYKTNKQGDGKAFFLRWAALSLPVGIQVRFIGAVLGALYGAVVGISATGWASGLPEYVWTITGQIFGLLMQFIYFKMMQKNLTSCSSGSQQSARA